MKRIFSVFFLITTSCIFAQQALFIPDTLHGPVINLTMKQDSVQFFPGAITHTYAYNSNHYLGPTLILDQGSNVSITVTNQLDDTTTVHWHGLHVPPGMDGGPHQLILPGATWNPQFTMMNSSATFWYHPHTHMKTAAQAIRGADGMIIVRDPVEAALNLPRRYGIDDFPIIVQSIQFDSLNQAMPRGMEDSTLLVNGTLNPYLDVPAQVVRLRLLNASGERSFNFGFTNNMSFSMIGTDGGLLNAPVTTTRIRLSPGERAEILLNLNGMNSQIIQLMSYASELPMGTQGGPTMPMPPWAPPMDSPINGIDFNILQLNIVAQTANPVTTIPASLVSLTPLQISQTNTFRTIHFTSDSLLVMDGPFYFNDSSFDMMRIDYVIPLNSIETWTLINETMVAHPFHMHDVQFFVLDRNGIPVAPEERGQKDVVLVQPNDTVRFITKFSDFADSTMPYMFHCHILMHEDDGMMGQFVVSQNAVGIHNIPVADNGISVYPNPFSTATTIQFADDVNMDNVKIEISEVSGRVIRKFSSQSHSVLVERNGLASGVYFFTVFENGKNPVSRKIIVTE
jgi:blue copper oxidase